jgi:hypothetical protein
MGGMEPNPYESPKPAGKPPGIIGMLVLRLIAICLWAMSLFLVLGIATTWNRPDITARSAANPALAGTIWTVGFVLPIIGFTILGVASWCKRWALALAGASAFIPLLAFISYHALRRL